jgi:hypothetical protein
MGMRIGDHPYFISTSNKFLGEEVGVGGDPTNMGRELAQQTDFHIPITLNQPISN